MDKEKLHKAKLRKQEEDSKERRRINANDREKHESTINYFLIFAFAIASSVLALLLDDPQNILNGLSEILLHPSPLLYDYIAIGGIGASLINLVLIQVEMLFLALILKARLRAKLMGILFMSSGFAFFGVNPLNSLPIIVGVLYFQKRYHFPKQSILILAYHMTALSPLVSSLASHFTSLFPLNLLFAALVGLILGYLAPPLSTRFNQLLEGFNLYNVGFTAGMIGMLSTSLLSITRVEVNRAEVLSEQSQVAFLLLLAFFTLALLISGVIEMSHAKSKEEHKTYKSKKKAKNLFSGYQKLLADNGNLNHDWQEVLGLGPCLFNMGLMLGIGILLLLLLQSPQNGPVLGALMGFAGYSAFGKHPKNSFGVILGIFLAHFLTRQDRSATGFYLSLFYGTALAPLGGEFGQIAGFIAGFGHLLLVSRISDLHMGVNLYNNGFSTGITTLFYLPLFSFFRKEKKAIRKKL